MDLKGITVIQAVKNDREYRFSLQPDAPIGEVYDVITEMRLFVAQKIQEQINAEKPKEEAPKEE